MISRYSLIAQFQLSENAVLLSSLSVVLGLSATAKNGHVLVHVAGDR